MEEFAKVGWLLVTATALSHCASVHGDLSELRARAAFDLGCAQETLQIERVAERTAGVVGCGRRATYVWAYQNQSWLLDNRSGSDPGGLAVAASPALASSASPAPAAPADPKACALAEDFKRRASNASGAAQTQLLKMAERKEDECRSLGKGP